MLLKSLNTSLTTKILCVANTVFVHMKIVNTFHDKEQSGMIATKINFTQAHLE